MSSFYRLLEQKPLIIINGYGYFNKLAFLLKFDVY